jgi:predicted TIM-barrel fold metal-dependent hydrolase
VREDVPASLQISADSHVVEPPEVFTSLSTRFGDAAPGVVPSAEHGHEYLPGNGRATPVAILGRAGIDPASTDWKRAEALGYEVRPGILDVAARLKDQELDGVAAEVLYPSLLLSMFSRQESEPELVKAAFASYNEWVAGYAGQAPRNLFPLACIQLHDLDEAAAEIERSRKLGHVGACIPSSVPTGRPYADPVYDSFWAQAQELRMPLAFHIGTGAVPGENMPTFLRERGLFWTLFPTIISITIGDLILGGVCERFPNIKFVVAEFDTGWIATFLNRLDWAVKRDGYAPGLSLTPSEYWQRNFVATFEDDEVGIRTRDLLGVHTLLWASDYPHGDSTWPDSRATLERVMKGCSHEDRRCMTAGNVVELYSLPLES